MRPRSRYRHRHGYGPPAFARRAGCAFAALLCLAILGTRLVSQLGNTTLAIVTGVVVVAILGTGFALSLRRVIATFRRQDALRRQLMADVAHELRTPLAILQGRVEGLIDGVYPRDDQHLDALLGEIDHLTRLVEDLRTIANAEAGALELRKERIDLAELARDVAGRIEGPSELMIDADPVRMREVLLNLLTNAKRYSDDVRVQLEAHPNRAVLRVADKGAGIHPEELRRIFDRFHKGRDSSGSGLGLAIAKNLVEAHGGTIEARSAMGEGTTVTVILPR